MKVGLALSGGGAKGAFQQGALEALKDAGIFPYLTVISGVSIGALHAVCVATDQLTYSKEIWLTVDKKIAFADGLTLLERLKAHEYDILNQGLFPVDTLDHLLDHVLTPAQLNYDVYIGTTKLSKKNPTFSSVLKYNMQHLRRGHLPIEYIHLNSLLAPLMKKILLASAAIPVVFKPVQVGDTVYVDGGIYNNVPLKPLIDEKMDKILVIDLFKYNVRRKAFVDAIPIYHIHPHRYLGKVLDFNPIKAEENIRYGYQTVTDQLNDIKHFLALD